VKHSDEAKDTCPKCGFEIDPEVCWCGEDKEHHNPFLLGHNFVPMGCSCGYVTDEEIKCNRL
jgi:hypothetical protein